MGNKQTSMVKNDSLVWEWSSRCMYKKRPELRWKFRALLQQKTQLMRQSRHEVTGTFY